MGGSGGEGTGAGVCFLASPVGGIFGNGGEGTGGVLGLGILLEELESDIMLSPR